MAKGMSMNPSRLLLLGFALAVLVGGLLLALPVSGSDRPIPIIDAFFTATSAVCVTGLSVLDLATGFSFFGQVVILLLIQIGGIGIMTLSTMLMMIVGQRVSISSQDGVTQIYTPSHGSRLRPLLRQVFLVTVAVEFTGAALLFYAEMGDLPPTKAVWHAAFHSISAFCNAGMSLRTDNFIGYRNNALVVMTLSFLIVTGGLGFSVLTELLSRAARRLRRLTPTVFTLHAKLCLCMTAILLVVGTVGYAVLEWGDSLAGTSLKERLLASFFASVTARTAGFNLVSYADLTIPTLILTMLLMLIGGCPGSTAGGIKASSLGVMLAMARARYLGEDEVSLFRRTIPGSAVARATTLTVLAILVIVVAAFALMVSEVGAVPYKDSGGASLGLMFEAVSALCTVGLSTGLTPGLSPLGKVVVMILMYVGRVGPLTVAIAVVRQRPKRMIRHVEEQVMIG